MAVFEYYQDMHDVRLKPRLLRSLLKNYLPNEQHPIPNPSELSSVVSSIKTHGLLSESFGKPVEGKLMEKWKSTVDDWIDGLLTLVSSKMPDKCWVGICLLGITCQECSDDRFLLSHSSIFQELLSQIQYLESLKFIDAPVSFAQRYFSQPPSSSHFVKVAACASLSDLFTRLGGFPTLKKDASSKAGKLIPPIVKLLSEDASEAVLEGAVELLCTLINFFPYSVHRHYDNVESVIVSKIMSGKYTANMSKKLAYCLALLPRTKGDEESWSLMMQKILISLSVHLNDVFQGLEEEDKSSEVIRLLVPPGKDPPLPLGGQLSVEAANQAANRSEQMLLSTVSTLMMCCCLMLTNPTSVQVTVPVRPLLALVRRVLLVDGSVSQSLMRFMTVMQQEFICLELPGLHAHSLDILTAIIKGVNSQLLPYGIDIVRLLTEYFQRCALPALRIKVYSILQILLISVGVGITRYLDQEIIDNAFIDLDSGGHVNCMASSNTCSKLATYAQPQNGNRKRKHATGENQNVVNKGMEPPKNKPTAPISVQIAALQALEALLAVGGALISGSQRSNVDLLLITVATKVCDGGWASREKGAFISSAELTSSLADFQLAALHALLASLLSPARVRPPYLSQGLELFRKGRQQTGTKLAESCVLALSALEVLIHPRALPLTDHLSSNHNTFDEGYHHKENAFSAAQQHKSPFSRGGLGMGDPDADDDLYKSWLGNGEETEAPVSNTDKQMEDANEPSQNDIQKVNIDYPTGKDIIEIPQDGNRVQLKHSSDVEMGESRNKFLDETKKTQISISHGDLGTSVEKGVAILTGSSRDGEIENITGQRDSGALNHSAGIISSSNDLTASLEMASSRMVTGSAAAVAMPGGDVASFTTEPVLGEGKGIVPGDDSDLDSFPDIVDGDPDTE